MAAFITDHPWVAGLYFLVAILVVCVGAYCMMRYVWKWLSYAIIPGIAALLIALIPAPILWTYAVHIGFVIFSFFLVLGACVIAGYYSWKEESKDDLWYWLALGTSVFGPALGLIFGLKQEVDGPITIPWGIILSVIVIIALAIFLVRKYRKKKVVVPTTT